MFKGFVHIRIGVACLSSVSFSKRDVTELVKLKSCQYPLILLFTKVRRKIKMFKKLYSTSGSSVFVYQPRMFYHVDIGFTSDVVTVNCHLLVIVGRMNNEQNS